MKDQKCGEYLFGFKIPQNNNIAANKLELIIEADGTSGEKYKIAKP
jgi:hypothetical protein